MLRRQVNQDRMGSILALMALRNKASSVHQRRIALPESGGIVMLPSALRYQLDENFFEHERTICLLCDYIASVRRAINISSKFDVTSAVT